MRFLIVLPASDALVADNNFGNCTHLRFVISFQITAQIVVYHIGLLLTLFILIQDRIYVKATTPKMLLMLKFVYDFLTVFFLLADVHVFFFYDALNKIQVKSYLFILYPALPSSMGSRELYQIRYRLKEIKVVQLVRWFSQIKKEDNVKI